jgi:formylglycine-generating enzyme required for sulfatase activity
MVFIPGGRFLRGSENGAPDEQPVREITLDGFWIDSHEVTNEEFTRFVRETGYVTVAERRPDPAQYPGVPPEKLVPGAAVFHAPKEEVSLADYLSWWEYVPGADWRHPEGPGSSLHGRERHPVVQVCWFDAVKYAEWAGKRLPTEAEWEYAARGGLQGADFVWGAELNPQGRHMANIWQGRFPHRNSAEDGYATTAPVGSFPPNRYGLYDMAGNVWEWCADWYRPDYFGACPDTNPPGPSDSLDPDEPGVSKRVQRGGSFLCNEVYCNGYRPSTRMKASPDTALCHSGFRCVISAGSVASLGR